MGKADGKLYQVTKANWIEVDACDPPPRILVSFLKTSQGKERCCLFEKLTLHLDQEF